MYCQKCGTENINEANFCRNCGNPFFSSVPSKEKPAPPQNNGTDDKPCRKKWFSILVVVVAIVLIIIALTMSNNNKDDYIKPATGNDSTKRVSMDPVLDTVPVDSIISYVHN